MRQSSGDQTGATFRCHRVLPFSPPQVFEAFARPELLARWWGPSGFTNSFEVFEFFLELHVPSNLVIQHVSRPRYLLTVTLAAHEAGTTITWAQEFEDRSVAARIRHIVEPANEQNLDRLLSVLTGGQP